MKREVSYNELMNYYIRQGLFTPPFVKGGREGFKNKIPLDPPLQRGKMNAGISR